MENTAVDYKKLYEESLVILSKKENALAQKEEAISQAVMAIANKDQTIADKDQTIADNEQAIAKLQFELAKFLKYFFGKKSEKLPATGALPGQMDLFELGVEPTQQEELSEQACQKVAKTQPKKRAKGTGRMVLPENLRREIILIQPEQEVSGCVQIGEEVTEVLELSPAEFYVKRYVRPKYAQPNGEGILIGSLPDRVIEKGIPSETVVAQMMVDKYVYAMPLHRQIDKYTRMGVRIPASTASDWILKGGRQLIPLWELHQLMVLNQKYLQVDESPIKVLDKNHKNGIHQGYMWVYHAPADQLVLYDYRRGRDSSGPREMLRDFKGILQTDGYSVYEKLFAHHPTILLVYCMAHARRKFVEAQKDNREKADHVLHQMQLLYTLEAQMREQGLNATQKTELRQEKALPILEALGKWMEEQVPQVRPTSPLGQALAYTLYRWKGLSAYAQHGTIEIDNNQVENSIRPLAVGRKNYLFAGSHHAAEITAAMYSFMATCKKNGINEMEWLTDVLSRIQSHKQKELYQLLPNNWQKYRPLPNTK